MARHDRTITITYGEVAENHVGNQQIGTGIAPVGFTIEELEAIRATITDPRYPTELIRLNEYLPRNTAAVAEVETAAILIIRNGVDYLLGGIGKTSDDMYNEQINLNPDNKYFDVRRGKVLNKIARHNLCFSETGQIADYERKKGTIIPFNDVECVCRIREMLGTLCGNKGSGLQAEGNYYYDVTKCGIGFHGDGERKIVIAIRLGQSMPLHYQWHYQSKPIGERVRLVLNHGDLYIMSEKATGHDWKRRVILTLRHAAGADKYLKDTAQQVIPTQMTPNMPVLNNIHLAPIMPILQAPSVVMQTPPQLLPPLLLPPLLPPAAPAPPLQNRPPNIITLYYVPTNK